MVIYFSGLNLTFLDVELEESDDESTLGAEDAASALGDVDPPPSTA